MNTYVDLKINALLISKGPGLSHFVDHLDFKKEGIVKDYHQDGHCVLIETSAYTKILTHNNEALCLNKYYPNILVHEFPNLNIEDRLLFNEVLLEIVELGKVCFGHEACLYFQKHGSCPLVTHSIKAKIIQEGFIQLPSEKS